MPDDLLPDAPSGALTRRQFLHGAVTLVCAAPLASLGVGCGDDTDWTRSPSVIDGWDVPAGTTLEPRRFATLVAMLDAFIPGDEARAGATRAHAAYYVDQLLGAFRTEPPRIFAGGPYSGRHGGVASFQFFQPLTRVERLRWQTYIEGSQGIAEREWAGPVVGLVERYQTNLDTLQVSAGERRFTTLALDERRSVVGGFDEEFVTLAYQHAVEGTYGDPVYGGNYLGLGWAAVGYEGDRQPIGYTARQMSHPEEG
jgi:hypothetical protein